MKKILYIVSVALSIIFQSINSQEFEFTPNNFVDKGNPDKNYIVIDIPNTLQRELFNRTKKYVNTVFNNPKFITSETDGEQIVVDGMTSKPVTVIYDWTGKNQWLSEYKIEFQFKDNRIKFTPFLKKLKNEDGKEILLVGSKTLGVSSSMFNEKGKINKAKGNEYVENYINDFLNDFKNSILINKSSDNDW